MKDERTILRGLLEYMKGFSQFNIVDVDEILDRYLKEELPEPIDREVIYRVAFDKPNVVNGRYEICLDGKVKYLDTNDDFTFTSDKPLSSAELSKHLEGTSYKKVTIMHW